jgi:hypothetical protein
MWPAAPEVDAGRPLAARWPRAAALACGWCATGYGLLLVAPQAILTRWTSVPRSVREVVAALWFAAGFVALVAVLVRAQRSPARVEPGA